MFIIALSGFKSVLITLFRSQVLRAINEAKESRTARICSMGKSVMKESSSVTCSTKREEKRKERSCINTNKFSSHSKATSFSSMACYSLARSLLTFLHKLDSSETDAAVAIIAEDNLSNRSSCEVTFLSFLLNKKKKKRQESRR